MQDYIVKLTAKKLVAEETWLFTFVRPDNLQFQAGQYVMLEIMNDKFTDDRPKFRAMSIASAPNDNYLNFAMRESESAFKQNIIAMEIGEKIKVKGPIGHFILPKDQIQPIVFLTAGIGITPIRSMLRQEVENNSERNISVFYSNRNVENITFSQEMKEYKLKNYQYISTLTREIDGWSGELGRIDSKMLHKYLDEIHQPLYYIVGTMSFIKAMQEMLSGMSISSEKVITDNFG